MSYSYAEKYNSKRLTENSSIPNRDLKNKDEPKKNSSLAIIKKLSMQARKNKDPNEVATMENTEKNRLLFKSEVEESDEVLMIK